MNAFIDRLVDEHKQLVERKSKLDAALRKPGFCQKVGQAQYLLMSQQLAGMEVYEDALCTRLLALSVDPNNDYATI